MNLNSRVKLQSVSNKYDQAKDNDDDYREWLLKPAAANPVDEVKSLQKENRSYSFEFLDMEKGKFKK